MRSRGLDRRIVLGTMQDVARYLEPIVMKRSLHLSGRRTLDAKMRIAPVLGVLRLAIPLVRDTDAAGKTDAAVDDQQLAVRAVVEPRERVPVRPVVAAHFDACGLHFLDVRIVDLPAAYPVEQDMNVHSGPRTLGKRIGEALADGTLPVNIRFKAYGMTRGLDRRQHRG